MNRLLTPKLPPHAPGMTIGLYGGSFDPPHDAHRKVALAALKRLGLDRVWALVTPGNPLKHGGSAATLDERIDAARALFHHPRIVVTGVEAEIGSSRTADVLAHLAQRAPGVRFVWIMGADNLAQLHRWGRWERIAALAPIAVIDRPGATFSPLFARAAVALEGARIDEADAHRLPFAPAPAWVFLHGPRSTLSSTELRGRNASA